MILALEWDANDDKWCMCGLMRTEDQTGEPGVPEENLCAVSLQMRRAQSSVTVLHCLPLRSRSSNYLSPVQKRGKGQTCLEASS